MFSGTGFHVFAVCLCDEDAREEAMTRLEDEALKLGANAVVSLRLSSTNIAANSSEVMVYGTAVVIE